MAKSSNAPSFVNTVVFVIAILVCGNSCFAVPLGTLHTVTSSYLENKGQWDSRAKYLLRCGNVNCWITDSGVVYDLFAIKHSGVLDNRLDQQIHAGSLDRDTVTRTGHVVRMSFVNTIHSEAGASNPQQGTTNYFFGSDSTKWVTGVRSFSDVRINNLYKGVDAAFYCDEGRPRYDLVIQPGADLSTIAMKFDGAEELVATADGDLLIKTTLGNIEQQGLYAYQMVNGNKKKVECTFHVGENVEFAVGDYDREKQLVIDPLIYSTYLGGIEDDESERVAIDRNGNVYVVGHAQWSDVAYPGSFPTSFGAYQTVHGGGGGDAFVTKLNPELTAIVYSTFLGGSGDDGARGIAIDSAGCAYVTGGAWSGSDTYPNHTDFPTTPGAFQVRNNGRCDAFVTKLNASGTAIIYSTYLGGNEMDFASGIATDSAGNAFISGTTSSSGIYPAGFPTSADAIQRTFHGGLTPNGDAFVTKLNSTGTAILYSTYLGGSREENGTAIAIDRAGNAYITGCTRSTGASPEGFPTSTGAYQNVNNTPSNGGFFYGDAFISKIDPTGTKIVYSTYLGGSNNDLANAIAVDDSGNAFVTGWTASTGTYPSGFPVTMSAFQTSNHGGQSGRDAFVAEMNALGTAIVFSTYLGGSGDDEANDIALDKVDNVYVTGWTKSIGVPPAGFPVSKGSVQIACSGDSDAFVTKFNSTGALLLYSTCIGGSNEDAAHGIAIAVADTVVVTGRTNSRGAYPTGFPTSSDAFQTENNSVPSYYDAFLTKLSLTPNPNRPVIFSSQHFTLLNLPCSAKQFDSIFVLNVGTDTLLITAASFSGGNNCFSLVSPAVFPVSVSPGDSIRIVLAFSAVAIGPQTAILSLANNDLEAGHNPWNINVEGIVGAPRIVIAPSISLLACPNEPVVFTLQFKNDDTLSHNLFFSGVGCTFTKSDVLLSAGQPDSLIASFAGTDSGTYFYSIRAVDECGGSHGVGVTIIVQRLPAATITISSDTGSYPVGTECPIYVVAHPSSSITAGANFIVINEATALQFLRVASTCVNLVSLGINSVTLSAVQGHVYTSDTIGILFYRSLVGSTLTPTVTLRVDSSSNSCASISGANSATLLLQPPGCELGTVIVHPFSTKLQSLHPNPAIGVTTIIYSSIEESNVTIDVLDMLGRIVAIPEDQIRKPGTYAVVFDPTILPTGVYHVVMRTGKFVSDLPLVRIR